MHARCFALVIVVLLSNPFMGGAYPGAAVAGTDYATVTLPGWDGPVVPRPAADGSWSSMPYPPAMPGDGPCYVNVCGRNLGDLAPPGNTAWRIFLDGIDAVWLDLPPVAPFSDVAFNDLPTWAPGGRHTFSSSMNGAHTVPEDSYDNNHAATQFVFTPATLNPNSYVFRPKPPHRSGGWGSGTPPIPNQDGVRLALGPPDTWGVLGMVGTGTYSDFDLRLYAPSTGLLDGFDTPLASSARTAHLTDVIVINNDVRPPSGVFDAGIVQITDGEPWAVARVDYRSHPGAIALGFDGTVPYLAEQLVDVRNVWVDSFTFGPTFFEVTTPDPSRPFAIALFSPSFGVGNLGQAVQWVGTDESGVARISATLVEGMWGLVIYRDDSAGLDPVNLALRVVRPPADLATVTPSSAWHGPVVPQSDPWIVPGSPVPTPTTLIGDHGATWLYWTYGNVGLDYPQDFYYGAYVDGLPYWNALDISDYYPGTFGFGRSEWYWYIRGGRHTVGLRLDETNTNLEISETNNTWAEQWIWEPAMLPPETAVSRAHPPHPWGGRDWIQGPSLPNLDGVRTPDFQPSAENGQYALVAVMPEDVDTDVNLEVYPLATGVQDGFVGRHTKAISANPGPAIDYVLVNCGWVAGGNPGAWDLAISSGVGAGAYRVETTEGIWIPAPDLPVESSPVTIEAGDLAQ